MVSLHSHLAEVTRKLRRGAALIVFCLTASFAHAQTNLVTAWLNAQTNVKTWSADLVETRALKSLAQPLTSPGRVWFAAPNRFHWELGNPPQTIAVRSADEMFVIYPRLKRAERYSLAGVQSGPWRDALSLLEAGFPRSQADLDARFRILSQSVTNEVCEITLQPKAAAGRRLMPQIKIAFGTNDFSLRATELHFADGSTMRNDFTNAVINPDLDEKLFRPVIPSDFKIVEPLKQR